MTRTFFPKLLSFFSGFISISNIKKILLKLKWYWLRADVPGRMLILVFFTPSIAVLLWLLFDIAYLIVFTLPGIVIKIIAQIFLFCIFWSAAVYSYEKLHSLTTEDSAREEETVGTQNEASGKTENERKSKWRRKSSI